GSRVERTFALSEIPDAMPTSQRLAVTIGNDVGVNDAFIVRSRRTNEVAVHANVQTLDELPDSWLAYSGVDVLIIPARHAMWAEQGTAEKIRPIVEWVRLGGTAILSCGEHCETLLSGKDGLGGLAPGTFAGIGYERETSALEEFVGSELPVNVMEADGATQLPYAKLDPVDGTVVFSEGIGAGRHPAVVIGMIGLGKVIFTTFDLDSDSLAAWNPRTDFVRRLIDFALGATDGDERKQVGTSQYGYDDIIGQFRMALGTFPGVGVTSFLLVSLLIVGYVLLIGPVDYFFHRRISKRFELTWLTFPLLVAAACGLAYYLTTGQGGSQLQLNRVSVVDVDAETHRARGSGWWYLYSPKAERLNLWIESNSPDTLELRDSLTMWDGLPGGGFGGMNGGMTSQRSSAAYWIDAGATGGQTRTSLVGLPINVRSSRSFYTQWTGQFETEDNDSALRVSVEKELTGTVENSLPFQLDRCWLVYGRWVYKLGSLRPGQQKSLQGIRSLDLKRLLTKQEFDKGRYKMTPWDRDSTDINEIMKMMMFFSSVRGESYTGLMHRYQDHLDRSRMLQDGRAMLVGESSAAATKLVHSHDELPRGGELTATDATTYFRLSIPVDLKR
ncbi:MAG: hypothetical protein KDB27_21320, partial [Planctomycetales bacterium]|nr:hypothetical protein [Planctomycetales bacterium]